MIFGNFEETVDATRSYKQRLRSLQAAYGPSGLKMVSTKYFKMKNISESTIDHIQHWKMQEIWNQFHRQNHLILKGFSNFQRKSSKSYISSNFYQVCTPTSKNFLCDTAVTRISFFLEILSVSEKSWSSRAILILSML